MILPGFLLPPPHSTQITPPSRRKVTVAVTVIRRRRYLPFFLAHRLPFHSHFLSFFPLAHCPLIARPGESFAGRRASPDGAPRHEDPPHGADGPEGLRG